MKKEALKKDLKQIVDICADGSKGYKAASSNMA